MAEKGAHLTRILQIKPSIFDFVAQESLDSLLDPAIRRVIKILAERNSSFTFLSKWFNEFFYIGHLVMQLHYLKKFGSTFSETFYGLKRISAKTGGSRLARREILLSLMFCSLVPYLRNKLNDVADKIYFDVLPFEKEKERILLLKSIVNLNKYINISLQLVTFVQYLRYLSGKSQFVSPFLWASQLKLEYAMEEASSREGLSLRNFLPQVLRRSFEITAFFLQFYQWWHTDRVGTADRLPIPPAPEVKEKGVEFAGLCPICGGKRRLETVLSVSGYVFCFECISEYITVKGSCPVTDLPASKGNLIRLFSSN